MITLVVAATETALQLPDVYLSIFPLLAMGIAGAASSFMKSRSAGKQSVNDFENRLRYQQFAEQQFDPAAPYRRLAKAQFAAAAMRAWGYDKIFGEDFLKAISDPKAYPGTERVGGAGYMDPSKAGFKRSGSTLGDIFSGIAGGMSAAAPFAGPGSPKTETPMGTPGVGDVEGVYGR